MINRNEAHDILSQIIKYSQADKTIAYLTGGKFALTRFAENTIHQNVFQKDYRVKVISIIGNQMGCAEENIFNPESLKSVVDMSYKIAKAQSKGFQIPEFANGAPIVDETYDEETILFSRDAAAERVLNVINKVQAKNCVAAGTFQNYDELDSLMTSEGQFCYQTGTSAAFTLTVMNGDKSGYGQAFSTKICDLKEDACVEKAIETATNDLPLMDVKPGKYTVVLSPDCVSEFIMFMAYLGFNGKKYLQKQTFMNGKIGQKIVSNRVTILDDCHDTHVAGLIFDYEGNPRKTVELISKGVAKNIVTDSLTARKLSMPLTGHALPMPSTFGPVPINLKMLPAGDKTTIEDLIASTENGIYISRFHYTNVVEPMHAVITGLTRDGSFVIKNGKIVGRTRTLRFNESSLTALSNIEGMTGENSLAIEGGWKFSNPGLKLKDFNITHEVS